MNVTCCGKYMNLNGVCKEDLKTIEKFVCTNCGNEADIETYIYGRVELILNKQND